MDGIVLVDKPRGWTSHDVVAVLRRRSGQRTGHAGTLDPFATGLLLVLLGRATRLQRFFMALPKTYQAVARFGAVSSTHDPEGEITPTGVLAPATLELPTGVLRQRPPMTSAIKVDGERAYRRARRGEHFELPEREVEIYRFEQLWREGERAGFELACSSGTYVRSLIADLGDAYCEALRRTRIGPFVIEDADPGLLSGEHAGALPAVSLARALGFMETVQLQSPHATWAAHGRPVPRPGPGRERPPGPLTASDSPHPEAPAPERAAPAAPVLLVDAEGPIAVAEPRRANGETLLKPIVGLRG